MSDTATQPIDGGPAFPKASVYDKGVFCSSGYDGMTLRDWFAGMALTNLALHAQPGDLLQGSSDGSVDAIAAYKLADAMLNARKTDDG